MSFFQQFQGSRLYLATSGPTDAGWLAYQFPIGAPVPSDGVELAAALGTQPGSFVFSATPPDLSTAAALASFLTAVDAVISQGTVANRGIAWLLDPANVVPAQAAVMGLNNAGSSVTGEFTGPIIPSSMNAHGGTLSLNVIGGTALALTGDVLQIGGSFGSSAILFRGASSPNVTQVSTVQSGTLPMTGPWRGCLRFGIYLQRSFLGSAPPAGFGWGCQFLAPANNPGNAIGAWLPLANSFQPNGADMLGFAASFDPSDPYNLRGNPGAPPIRSVMAFTGTNQAGDRTLLVSGYATSTGAIVTLTPVAGPLEQEPRAARLLFNAGPLSTGGSLFQVAPHGDFVLGTANAQAGKTNDLMCGLHGTEFIAFHPAASGQPGDRLVFTARSPAYAPGYPFQPASPVGPPSDPEAVLLDATYTTAWASVAPAPTPADVKPPGIAYVAQPKGGPLYGRDDLIYAANKSLFGSRDPSVVLPQGVAVPMVPYGLVQPGDGTLSFRADQIEAFENAVVGPTRRRLIGAAKPSTAVSRAAARATPTPTPPAPFNTTTPTGLLVTVGSDGGWSKILLGQNLSPITRQMYFCNPDPLLQEAFQTGQLFLVVANAAKLGALSGVGIGDCDSDPAFYNEINVGDWRFRADIGQSSQFGDYTNVMIVKGRKGALWDPSNPTASLVASPDQWTLRQVFAAPADLQPNPNPPPPNVPGAPNPDELVALSYWLQGYFQDAVNQQDHAYFGNFNRIASDPNWTGILILRLTISDLPASLIGIRAGVAAPRRFNAHHLGIDISQIANDPTATDIELKASSSMFRLIYYLDPDFIPPVPPAAPQPVAPAVAGVNDFRLLSLKALFVNTAVQKFESYAQLTFGTLFGMPIDHMGPGGNPYATVVLTGSYQDNDGHAVYSLGSAATSTFYFNSNIFTKIEIDSAQMTTRDTGATSGQVVSWFGLTGFLDFACMQYQPPAPPGAPGAPPAPQPPPVPFDLLSFGSDPAAPGTLRSGLAFSNLGLTMTFPVSDPTNHSIVFTSGDIRFDAAHSTPRPGGLYTDFALGLQGLASGSKADTPDTSGFLQVITDVKLNGVSGGDWYGLTYQLDMGSPGALAGSVGLSSSLIVAWSPTSSGAGNYKALLGIRLPGTGGGAKLISLQTVLKLSIGQIRLTRGNSSFLLMLTEIALQFLGILKLPPSGSSLFYLFGNPQSAGKASGLGWYAMYRNPASSAVKSAALVSEVRQ